MTTCVARLGTLLSRGGLFIALTAIATVSSTAYADSIRVVTAGDVDAHEGDNTFVLIGSDFHLSGEVPLGGPLSQCFPCTPGMTIDLSTTAGVGRFGDPATFDGQTFDGFPQPNGGPFFSGQFSFASGTVTVPDVLLDTIVERSAPFVFTGNLAAFDNLGLSGTPLFSTNLTGRGTAVLQFSNNTQVGLLASRISFRFEPAAAATPEPATIFLVGPALAGLALVRRRRSQTLS